MLTRFVPLTLPRFWLLWLGLAFAGLITPRGIAQALSNEGGANVKSVLLITMDTTRKDHVGCYGRRPSPTPNLDQLCARSVRFEQAVAVAPVTLPAHASIMTGRYPAQHGARHNGEFKLAAREQTLATLLKQRGYETAAFVSAFVLDRRYGLDNGFEHYDDRVGGQSRPFSGVVSERNAEQVTDAALQYLAKRKSDRPLFMWVHYFDAHAPYVSHGLASSSTDHERYSAEIGYMDKHIGRLLQAPTFAPTQSVISVLADHGESLGEHGEAAHGLFVYDATIAIPWMLAAPKLAPALHAPLASQIDVLPTVLGVLGVPAPAKLDGRDVLRSPREPTDTVQSEATLPYFDFRLAPLFSLRDGRAKLIQAPRPEFYRLATDPKELTNLIANLRYPADALALAKESDRLLKAMPKLDRPSEERPALDNAAKSRLQSLGYLSSTDLGEAIVDPKDAIETINLHQKAVAASSAGRVAEAIALLNDGLTKTPSARGLRYLRARLFAVSGQAPLADADLKIVNSSRPTSDSLLLQAQLWLLQNRLGDAETLIREALRLEPLHGGAYIASGDIALVRKDLPAARAAYEKALAIDATRVGRQAQSRLSKLP